MDSKKKIAHEVAAKYSTHLDMATHHYMKLTGLLDKAPKDFQYEIKHHFDDLQSCLKQAQKEAPSFVLENDHYQYRWVITCAKPFMQAQKQMLSVLDGYRHPVQHDLLEMEIFFGDLGIKHGPLVVGFPDQVRSDKDFNCIPKSLRQKICDYIDEAEDTKRHYKDCRKELIGLRKMIDHATDEFKQLPENDSSAKRNQRVAAAMGLAPGQKGRTINIDHDGAYACYVRLVRSQGKSRQDAIKIVRNEFDYLSNDTTIKSLHDSLLKVKKWWETTKRKKPSGLKEYWIGLIPDRRQQKK